MKEHAGKQGIGDPCQSACVSSFLTEFREIVDLHVEKDSEVCSQEYILYGSEPLVGHGLWVNQYVRARIEIHQSPD